MYSNNHHLFKILEKGGHKENCTEVILYKILNSDIHSQVQIFLKYSYISESTCPYKHFFIRQTFSLGWGATAGLARGKAMLGACGVGIRLSLMGVSGSLCTGFFTPSIKSPSSPSGTAVKVKYCYMTCLWLNITMDKVKKNSYPKWPKPTCCYNTHSYMTTQPFLKDALLYATNQW